MQLQMSDWAQSPDRLLGSAPATSSSSLPSAAVGDHHVARLSSARLASVALLAGGMPFDQIHAGRVHCHFNARESPYQIQREIELGGAAAGYDEPMAFAADDGGVVRPYLDVGQRLAER